MRVKDINTIFMKEKKHNNTNLTALTKGQKANIEISIQQLNEGKGIPIKKATKWLAKKYNLS